MGEEVNELMTILNQHLYDVDGKGYHDREPLPGDIVVFGTTQITGIVVEKISDDESKVLWCKKTPNCYEEPWKPDWNKE